MNVDLKMNKEIDDDTLQESKKSKKDNMCHNSKMLYHDCTISGRTYSNVTNKLYKVNCKGCLNAIMNNKSMIERYYEENSR